MNNTTPHLRKAGTFSPASNQQEATSQVEHKGVPARQLELRISPGNQLEELFYALMDKQKNIVHDMLIDFDRDDLTTLAYNWASFMDVTELLATLVPVLSYYTANLEEAVGRNRDKEKWREFEIYWQKILNPTPSILP